MIVRTHFWGEVLPWAYKFMNTDLKQNNTPSGWQEKSLGGLLSISKGKLPKKTYEIADENSVPYLSIKHLDGEESRYAHKSDGVIADKNDLLVIADGSGSGRMYRGYYGLVSSTFLKISTQSPNEISNDYLEVLFSHLDFTNSRFRKGGAIPHFDFKQLKDVSILLPPIKEQRKIAEILGAVDEDIVKTQEVIEGTEKLKRGLMQDILSFGNKEDVKYLPLGDIGKVSMCKRIFREETSPVGEIPFYKIGTFGKEPDAFISKELFDSYRRKFSFPKIGDVLLSAAGTIGRKVRYDGKPAYFQDSNIIWLEHDERKVLNSFLFYLYETITWQTEGSTIKRLYNSILLKKVVPVPSVGEQGRIVEILSAVDEKISINKKLKEKLTLLKKGLMQDLLSGTVRTNI